MGDAPDIDPFAEPFWPLGQTLAWIIWRTAAKASQFGGTEQAHPVDVLAAAKAAPTGHVEPVAAAADLLRRLQDGSMEASGYASRHYAGRALGLVSIRPVEWRTLAIDVAPIWGPDSVMEQSQQLAGDECGLPRYHQVRVARDRVLALWPAQSGRARAVATDDQVRSLLLERERSIGERSKIRAWKGWQEMKDAGVSKPRFERIWRELYPDTKRGRPEKSHVD
ncbi:hypothetical protein M2322_003198 [Rhodoblastus acidophilus]|uniref:hypothetical protein n=1 Tax=Rhodoblastus acidophilus TaxID=1074 RepID=UPI002224ABE2|nr:hypothetical protein [Rhodoblastus acidophilus]MCW2317634.1 hypothetical protein [Rhodoblastus acidophilus]